MNRESAKSAFREWITQNIGPTMFVSDIVNAAADIFAPERFSKVIVRKRRAFGRAHAAIVEFGSRGQWFTDDDLAGVIGCRVEAAGARRRELPKFGYVLGKREVSPGTWQHRIVSCP